MLKLNQAQHTSLSVRLSGLSNTCSEIERLVSAEHAPLLWQIENDLTDQERHIILAQVVELRQQIGVFANEWALTPEVLHVRRHIVAQLGIDWADLNDVRPHTLGRYGAVDPAAAAALEPALNRLIATVEGLLRFCQNGEQAGEPARVGGEPA